MKAKMTTGGEDAYEKIIKGLTSKSLVNDALKILEAKKDSDTKIKDVIIPRAKLMGALFKKGDANSKELAKLVRDKFVKDLETDYDDSTYATNLEELEKNLKKLEEFKS